MDHGFASDNVVGAHPKVIEALVSAGQGTEPSYGYDRWTGVLRAQFADHFGSGARAYFVLTGTAANVLCLQHMTRSHEAVICARGAHVDVDEVGAVEVVGGRKILVAEPRDGKLTPEAVEPLLARRGMLHAVQPRVLSVAESTEVGTTYSADELGLLCEWAHSRGLLVHLDGARLANAAAHLGTSLGALTTAVGVDAVSFGCAKNGTLLGEAVVLLGPGLGDGFGHQQKQSMQLAAKSRFVVAQIGALLTDDLWLHNARHANAMAQRLAAGASRVPGVQITRPVESNAVFATLPVATLVRLRARYSFPTWDDMSGEVRWMCSWSTDAAAVDAFVDAMR
jgi:threonine aldolase